MRALRPGRRVVTVLSVPLRLTLVIATALVAGCGAASVFNTAAPLAPDITIAYAVGGSNPPTTPGLTGLRGRDGAEVWHAATGEPNDQVSPVEVNGVIYTEGGSVQVAPGADQVGTVAAVRATDGHILWQTPLPTGTGTDDRDFRIATDGATVLVTDPAAGLYALTATTGAVRWHLSEPARWPLAIKDGLAVATLTDPQREKAHVVAYREEDGKVLWQGQDFPFGTAGGVGTIGINHTAVYTAGTGGQTGLLAYTLQTGRPLWRQRMASRILGVDDHTITVGILDGANSAARLDASTGRVLWSTGEPADGFTPLLQTQAALYVTDGQRLIALSMTTGTQLWRAQFAGYSVGSIAQAQGVVFAVLLGPPESAGPERLVALDGSRGAVYWERDQQIYALVNTQP